ncbi:MAG: hypothetical protein ACNS63_10340 [Candidatus Nitrospinota bacterium M3_3B_026]
MRFFAIFAAAVLFTSGAASASERMKQAGQENEHVKKVTGGESSGLTLIQVMQDLAAQLSRIQFGILTNNRHMIKQGAQDIADHPAPEGGIAPYIKKNPEQVKSVVPVMDKQVHKTAVEMTQAAGSAPMLELQKMADKITSGCVSCHDLFRD